MSIRENRNIRWQQEIEQAITWVWNSYWRKQRGAIPNQDAVLFYNEQICEYLPVNDPGVKGEIEDLGPRLAKCLVATEQLWLLWFGTTWLLHFAIG